MANVAQLPTWLNKLGIRCWALEADDGLNITVDQFYKLDQHGCNFEIDRILDVNVHKFEWLGFIYGPFDRVTFTDCVYLKQIFIFHINLAGDLSPSVPHNWVKIGNIYGDTSSGKLSYYIRRNIVKGLNIGKYYFILPIANHGFHSIEEIPKGLAIPGLHPLVFHVIDTYSKFSDNGSDLLRYHQTGDVW